MFCLSAVTLEIPQIICRWNVGWVLSKMEQQKKWSVITIVTINGNSVTFIDKIYPSDLLKRRDYWRRTLYAMTPCGLDIEDCLILVWKLLVWYWFYFIYLLLYFYYFSLILSIFSFIYFFHLFNTIFNFFIYTSIRFYTYFSRYHILLSWNYFVSL